jgi:hypothetical protein
VLWNEQALAVPLHEPGVVAFQVHPGSAMHVACANFDVHDTDVPLHEPVIIGDQVQPGVISHVVCNVCVPQLAPAKGVPTQRGPVVKICVAAGA